MYIIYGVAQPGTAYQLINHQRQSTKLMGSQSMVTSPLIWWKTEVGETHQTVELFPMNE